MSFKRYRGKTKTIYVPAKTSTAFTKGALVSVPSQGADRGVAIPATSTTTALTHVGVIKRAVASSDADYTLAKKVPVEVPLEKNVEWLATTSGAAATDIGSQVDLTDSVTVNVAASSVAVALVREVVSATQVVVVLKLNGAY